MAERMAEAYAMGLTCGRYKKTRFWEVRDYKGRLLVVTVYKRGAKEIIRCLEDAVTYSLTEQGREALAAAESADRDKQTQ